MDKRERESEGRSCLFSTRYFFFAKHLIMHRCGEYISHRGFYCDGCCAFKEPAPWLFLRSNPLFVCRINFHSGPKPASERKRRELWLRAKNAAPAYQIIAISRAKNHLAGCNGLMNHATFSHRDLLCSTDGREKKPRDNEQLSLHCLAADWHVIRKTSHFHLCMEINSLLSAFGVISLQSEHTSNA